MEKPELFQLVGFLFQKYGKKTVQILKEVLFCEAVHDKTALEFALQEAIKEISEKREVTPIELDHNKPEDLKLELSDSGLSVVDFDCTMVNSTFEKDPLVLVKEHSNETTYIPPFSDASSQGAMKSLLDYCFEYKVPHLTATIVFGAALGRVNPKLLVPLAMVGSFSMGASIPFNYDHCAYISSTVLSSIMATMRCQNKEKLGVVKAVAITDMAALAMTVIGESVGQKIHTYLYDDY